MLAWSYCSLSPLKRFCGARHWRTMRTRMSSEAERRMWSILRSDDCGAEKDRAEKGQGERKRENERGFWDGVREEVSWKNCHDGEEHKCKVIFANLPPRCCRGTGLSFPITKCVGEKEPLWCQEILQYNIYMIAWYNAQKSQNHQWRDQGIF